MTRVRLALGGLGLAVSLLGAAACVSESDRAPAESTCPSETDWPMVSQVLEHGCGTLDCHGAPSRPLRLFGRNGIRMDSSSIVGVDATTEAELAQNRDSVCGLEPELMTAVMAGDAGLGELTVIRKPRLIEAHKGGRVWVKDDAPGYVCFSSWIAGDVDVDACETDLQSQ
jgi:hypothetical protein